MDRFEEYEELIRKYLEGKLSIDEEELFINELNTNDDLCKQYEEELLVSALLEKSNAEGVTFLPGEKEINPLAVKQNNKRLTTFAKPAWYFAAATVALIIAGSIIFITVNNRHAQQPEVASRKSVLVVDSLTSNQSLHTKKPDSIGQQQLYNKFYSSYTAQNDPIEISNYYKYYKNGNYAKVILATRADYQVMSFGIRQQVIDNYMNLYKGLCYLKEDQLANAVKQFELVQQSTQKNTRLYNEAQWYLAMTYLKDNNNSLAASALQAIAQTQSVHKQAAEKILTELK